MKCVCLPEKVVESSSLEIFKSHLDVVLGNLLWVSLLELEVAPDGLQRGPFQPQQFCDSQCCQDRGEIPGLPGLSFHSLHCVYTTHRVASKNALLVNARVHPFIWGSTHQYPKATTALERGDLCW